MEDQPSAEARPTILGRVQRLRNCLDREAAERRSQAIDGDQFGQEPEEDQRAWRKWENWTDWDKALLGMQ